MMTSLILVEHRSYPTSEHYGHVVWIILTYCNWHRLCFSTTKRLLVGIRCVPTVPASLNTKMWCMYYLRNIKVYCSLPVFQFVPTVQWAMSLKRRWVQTTYDHLEADYPASPHASSSQTSKGELYTYCNASHSKAVINGTYVLFT